MKRLTEKQFTSALKAARFRNNKRDEMDRAHGFAAPNDCDSVVTLETIRAALGAAAAIGDADCLFEAIAMLDDLIDRSIARSHVKAEAGL